MLKGGNDADSQGEGREGQGEGNLRTRLLLHRGHRERTPQTGTHRIPQAGGGDLRVDTEDGKSRWRPSQEFFFSLVADRQS